MNRKENAMYRWFGACALCALLISAGSLAAAEAAKTTPAPQNFGTLQAPSVVAAKADALAWLKSTGKTDAATLQRFDTLWAEDRTLLDKVVATLILGDPQVEKLLADARDPNVSAPTTVPAQIKDTKLPVFYRANLAVAYAKALSSRRVYEEGLEALKTVKADQTVDPASYLFFKAVAEHALMLPQDAEDTITRLLDDVTDSPERYKMVAALMHFDMLSWKDKDLGWISRKMDNIERRLDLSRGGPITQKMQKDVVMRLDEIIKEKENQAKGQGSGNGGGCPSGGPPQNGTPGNNIRSSSPQQDSNGGNGTGPGNVDPKKIKELAENWGKLPEKERAKALVELTRDMPPRYREVIESYFKKLQPDTGSK